MKIATVAVTIIFTFALYVFLVAHDERLSLRKIMREASILSGITLTIVGIGFLLLK